MAEAEAATFEVTERKATLPEEIQVQFVARATGQRVANGSFAFGVAQAEAKQRIPRRRRLRKCARDLIRHRAKARSVRLGGRIHVQATGCDMRWMRFTKSSS